MKTVEIIIIGKKLRNDDTATEIIVKHKVYIPEENIVEMSKFLIDKFADSMPKGTIFSVDIDTL